MSKSFDEFRNVSHRHLVILANSNEHRRNVEEYANKTENTNIHFHDVVEIKELYTIIASADVGLVPTWNSNDLSYWFALDNKIFDYLRCGIPVLATQQPEYVKLIESYDVGLCINPTVSNAYLDGFNYIINQKYDSNINRANQSLNWENEKVKLQHLIKEIEIRLMP